MGKKNKLISHLSQTTESFTKTEAEAKGDSLDAFLVKVDDPVYWRTIPGGTKEKPDDFVLSNKEIEIIKRIQENEYADLTYDPFQVIFSLKIFYFHIQKIAI